MSWIKRSQWVCEWSSLITGPSSISSSLQTHVLQLNDDSLFDEKTCSLCIVIGVKWCEGARSATPRDSALNPSWPHKMFNPGSAGPRGHLVSLAGWKGTYLLLALPAFSGEAALGIRCTEDKKLLSQRKWREENKFDSTNRTCCESGKVFLCLRRRDETHILNGLLCRKFLNMGLVVFWQSTHPLILRIYQAIKHPHRSTFASYFYPSVWHFNLGIYVLPFYDC